MYLPPRLKRAGLKCWISKLPNIQNTDHLAMLLALIIIQGELMSRKGYSQVINHQRQNKGNDFPLQTPHIHTSPVESSKLQECHAYLCFSDQNTPGFSIKWMMLQAKFSFHTTLSFTPENDTTILKEESQFIRLNLLMVQTEFFWQNQGLFSRTSFPQ